MISTSMRIAVLLAIGIYFGLLAVLLRKKSLSLPYALLWLFSGLVMLVFTVFPGLLDGFTRLLGFLVASNALFALLFFCVLLILMFLTSVNSRHAESLKRLTQEVARLEKRLRELEDRGHDGQ